MDQLAARAARLKISKKKLAKDAGISDVYLSNLQSRTKTWRPLTPDKSRKIMEVLNYRASQIRSVESMLRFFKARRTKYRYLMKAHGIDDLVVQFFLNDEKEAHAVALEIKRKNRKALPAIFVLMNCDAGSVNFYKLPTKEEITWSQASKMLFPDRVGIVPFLGSILFTIRDQWWRAVSSDLDNFDTDEGTVRFQARKKVLSDKEGADRIVGKAQRIFEKFTDEILK